MCKWGTWEEVYVKKAADLSHTGEEYRKWVAIDACIADIIRALQENGIDMRHSCCDHGQGFGTIALQDGRVLIVNDRSFSCDPFGNPFHWGFKAFKRGIVLSARAFLTHLRWYLRRSR